MPFNHIIPRYSNFVEIILKNNLILDEKELQILNKLHDSNFENLEYLNECLSPASFLKVENDDLELKFSNTLIRLLSNNYILKLHDVPLKTVDLRDKYSIEILHYAYNHNKAMTFIMDYPFSGSDRHQPFFYKVIPIYGTGLLIILNYIDEKQYELQNSNVSLFKNLEIVKDQRQSLIQEIESKIFKILKFCNNDFVVVQKDSTISDLNLKDTYKFLIKDNKELQFFNSPAEKEYYEYVTRLINEKIIWDSTIFDYIEKNDFTNFLTINFQKISYSSDKILLIFKTEGKLGTKGKTAPNNIADYLQYPRNLSINVIQAKIIKYITNFTTVFDLNHKERQFFDLSYYHEDFISSIKERQFDAKHLIKFYLALTLSNPMYKLTRKDFLKILVDSNVLSYSIFSKIFPVIKSESSNLLYEKDGKICLNEEIKQPLNELLLKSFALMNEITIHLRIDNFESNFDSDLELNLKNLFENRNILVYERIEIFSEIIKNFVNSLKKNVNYNFNKSVVVISKEIPWYYGYKFGLYSRPFKSEYVPLLKDGNGYFYSNDAEIIEENLIVETYFPENDESWNDLIIVLNVNLIISKKVVDYQKKHNLNGLLLNYFPDTIMKEKNYFIRKSFNEKIVFDLRKRLNELHFDLNIMKFHIFCSIDFDLGLKLAQADPFHGIKHCFYTWDSEKLSFIKMEL